MLLIQHMKQPNGEWRKYSSDRYAMTVTKLCNRLCQRAGLRNEYASALRKCGSVIFINGNNIIKMEIKLEEKDGKHEFTGVTKDFTDGADASAGESHAGHEHPPGESCEVHSGRGDASADGRPGDICPTPESVPATGEV